MSKKIQIVAIVCVLMFSFMACGGSNKLVGQWASTDTSNHNFPDDLYLFSDGTGGGDGYSLEWTAENGKLKLTVSSGFTNELYVYDYKVNGKQLVLSYKDVSVKYDKK